MKFSRLLFYILLPLATACQDEQPATPGEFYGEIAYRVEIDGPLDSNRMELVRRSLGDSFVVAFTQKGYRLRQYGVQNLTIWFDNANATAHYLIDRIDSLYIDTLREPETLLDAGKRSGAMTILGRSCSAYSMQDEQAHIEMWYDSTLHISPERFSRLYDGHYYRYYQDCASPYLMRSALWGNITVRFLAYRIESAETPDPAWDVLPHYPVTAYW